MRELDFLRLIESIGGKVYVVGGWVRDKIMNCEPCDKDYAVVGVEESSFVEKFPEAKKIGNSFPVFTLDIEGEQREVAFARTEVKTSSGYTGFSVLFSPDVTIEEDLYRRDTTMNSMAWDLRTSSLIDPYFGSRDIKNKIIRATSEHFMDDPVRALRAARQSAQFGFEIEARTLEMMSFCARELSEEPKERIIKEMAIALATNKPSLYFRILEKSNLLNVVFPYLSKLAEQRRARKDNFEKYNFESAMLILDETARQNSRVEVRFAALIAAISNVVAEREASLQNYDFGIEGLQLLNEINNTMTLPKLWYKCADFTIKGLNRVYRITEADEIVDFLIRLSKNPIGHDGFLAVMRALNPKENIDFVTNYEKYMKAISSARNYKIPEGLKGAEIGEWVRQREVEAYKELV
ncbi:MAG: tRNA adenylyltransferase [Synergistaceae bacterium]|nr:tRNA adenylyltransferase [Synergistaceae bacterium]